MIRFLSALLLALSFFVVSPAIAAVPRECMGSSKEYDRRIAACTSFLGKGGLSVQDKRIAYYARGSAYYDKGNFDQANIEYTEALKFAPSAKMRSAVLNARADTWHKKGDFQRAAAEFDEAIRLDPNSMYPLVNRGNLMMDFGQFDRAIADFTRAIKLAPTSPLAYNSRGNSFRHKGEYDRAISDLDNAIRLDPKDPVYYFNRGNAWRLKGDLSRALIDQNQAVALSPRGGSLALVYRGDTYRYMGDFQKALADYNAALGNASDFIPAMTSMALTYERMGDVAQARVFFEKALASNSNMRFADVSRSARETAQARLAALASGVDAPVIPAAPAKATRATAVPTPAITAPILTQPVKSAASQAAPHGRRVALVIGNSAYQSVTPLPNPQKDASAIATSLRNIGFEVVTLSNDLTQQQLSEALRSFANEAEKSDWAMVYYAGHGIEVNGVNYLIPVDAKLKKDRDVEFETIPLDKVMTAVNEAKKIKIVMLDACRDNPFAATMAKTGAPDAVAAANITTAGGTVATRSVGRGLAEVKVSGATLVVYAAKQGQVALDGEGGNSPFAVAVVQRLATPGVEINKIFRLVRDDVMEATAGRQEPFTYGSLPGKEDFFFVVGR